MERLEKIHNLIDEINQTVKEVFPEYTHASITVYSDGMVHFNVIKFSKVSSKPAELTPRRSLFEQFKNRCGEWEKDTHEDMNAFFAKEGTLLGGGKR